MYMYMSCMYDHLFVNIFHVCTFFIAGLLTMKKLLYSVVLLTFLTLMSTLENLSNLLVLQNLIVP
jgi:hypothetical protein